MRRIGFVTLHAEGVVVDFGRIEAELTLWYGLHTVIAAEPSVVAFLLHFFLDVLLCFGSHLFAHLVLEVPLVLLICLQVVVSIWFDLVLLVFQQLNVNGLVRFDLKLVFICSIVIILVVEHA